MERLMTDRFLILPTIGDDEAISWFVFVVRLNDLFEVGDRDAVITELRQRGVGCNNYFPPIHLQPYMAQLLGHKPGDFPVCEYVAARTIALPFFSKMTARQVNQACDTLEKSVGKVRTAPKKRF
jgi:perosamine synthetase